MDHYARPGNSVRGWSIVITVLFGVGWDLTTGNPPDFKNARRCFWFAALIFGGLGITWGMTTDQPLFARLLVTGEILLQDFDRIITRLAVERTALQLRVPAGTPDLKTTASSAESKDLRRWGRVNSGLGMPDQKPSLMVRVERWCRESLQ
jgi:hypothetical protein